MYRGPVMIPISYFQHRQQGSLRSRFSSPFQQVLPRVKSGETVTGSETIPLSNFFTFHEHDPLGVRSSYFVNKADATFLC